MIIFLKEIASSRAVSRKVETVLVKIEYLLSMTMILTFFFWNHYFKK